VLTTPNKTIWPIETVGVIKSECRIKAITPAFQAGDGSSILPTRSKRTFSYGSPISADERNLDFTGVATQLKLE
jgi:hypothetical protein